MSLLNRMLGRKEIGSDVWQSLGAEIEKRLLEGDDPHQSERVSELLQRFWMADDALLPSGKTPLPKTSQSVDFYGDLIHRLRQSPMPATPQARYATVVQALHEQLIACQDELQGDYTVFALDRLAVLLTFVRQIRAVELHDTVCDLLAAVNRAIIRERGGKLSRELATLRQDMETLLTVFPPEAMPRFWERLQHPRTSPELWPVVARMRNRNAVPFLLAALPQLSEDGQGKVIAALGAMNDTRALAALQQIAANPGHLLSWHASQVVARLLRESGEDAAQLLRPTDSRHAGTAGETLLRPVEANPNETIRPDELLRASAAAHNEEQDQQGR